MMAVGSGPGCGVYLGISEGLDEEVAGLRNEREQAKG